MRVLNDERSCRTGRCSSILCEQQNYVQPRVLQKIILYCNSTRIQSTLWNNIGLWPMWHNHIMPQCQFILTWICVMWLYSAGGWTPLYFTLVLGGQVGNTSSLKGAIEMWPYDYDHHIVPHTIQHANINIYKCNIILGFSELTLWSAVIQ